MTKTLLWDSNAPITLTGYGLQTALFVPRIRDLGYDITISCPMSHSMAPIIWNGIPMLGCAGDPMGNDILPTRSAPYDLTITLRDLFGLMPCSPQLAGRHIAHWMPVDCDPMGEKDIATLRNTGGIPIAISQFGARMIRQEGFEPLYVPHGVDTQAFKPSDDRIPFRNEMGVNPDTYVIGMACVNKPDSRKGIDQQLQAFAIFHQRHPNSALFFHTVRRGGWELEKLCLNLGILNCVYFPEQTVLASQQITNQLMAAWYNSIDLFSACSEAEGFGLPILEAQACGIPVVTTNYSAMTELCDSGWLVEGQRHWTGGHESWWYTPSVEGILARYEEAWNNQHDSHKNSAREFALAYGVDEIVSNYWKPALEEIEKHFSEQ